MEGFQSGGAKTSDSSKKKGCFLAEYEERFEKEYGFLRPIITEAVERYLDCGNPRCGFARIRCPSCGEERLLMFSCRTRGFCPSCHAKRIEEWGAWMREELISESVVEKIMGWRHSGFSVHSKVRAKTRKEAERVGKYMIRPLLSLERLSLDEREGQVCYRYGEKPEEVERMDYLSA